MQNSINLISHSLCLIFFLANASAEGPLNFPKSKEFKVTWENQGALQMYVVKLGFKDQGELILTKSPSKDPIFPGSVYEDLLRNFPKRN